MTSQKAKILSIPFAVIVSPDLSGRSRDNEIATSPRQVGAPRNDTSPCRCEAGEVSRSNLGGDRGLPRFARNDKSKGARNDKKQRGSQ